MSLRVQKKLSKQLDELLQMHSVNISQPRKQMIQLNDVPVGGDFNQPMTNVLLRFNAAGNKSQVFVDEDLRYVGSDPHRQQIFDGRRQQGWLRLASELGGDVNHTIVWILGQLDCDLLAAAPQELQREFELADSDSSQPFGDRRATESLEHLDSRVVRLVENDELHDLDLEPTSAQIDAITLAAESVIRPVAPNFPLLMGPSGVGKTTVARCAAAELMRRGLVARVVEISGASICAGPIFLPERDERLREILDAIRSSDQTLAIFEQIDFVLAKSSVAASILADCLDSSVKIIGVARPEFSAARLKGSWQLRRRIEPCVLPAPDYGDVAEILRRRWDSHPLSESMELSPNVMPLVNKYSHRRLGANPASAIGLLEAVLNRAAFSGQLCVGPDDVFHLVRPTHSS